MAIGGAAIGQVAIGQISAASRPPANTDWPKPLGYPPGSLENRTFLNSVELQLLGQDQIYGAPGQVPTFDLPVPRGYPPGPLENRTFLNPIELQLLGQDKIFGAPGEVAPNYDWPVPKGSVFPVENRSFLNPIELQLVGQDRVYGAPGEVAPNYDWPIPPGPRPGVVTNRTHLDPLKLILLGQDSFYGAAGEPAPNYDWPVPPGPRPGLVTNRSHLDPLKVLLYGKDQFFGAPGEPPSPADLPNPYGRRYLGSDLAPNLLIGFIVPSPFSQYDWVTPRRAYEALTNRTHLDQLRLLLLSQDQFYGAPGEGPPNYDWPNPRGPIGVITNRTHLDPLKLLLRGQDSFFGGPGEGPTYDWPVPKAPGYPIQNRSHLDPLKLTLLGQDRFFGGPGEPPSPPDLLNPWGRRYPGSDSLNPFVGLLVVSSPFAQYDWFLPRGIRAPAHNLTHLDLLRLQLIGLDQVFGAPGQVPSFDWPNPRPYLRSSPEALWVPSSTVLWLPPLDVGYATLVPSGLYAALVPPGLYAALVPPEAYAALVPPLSYVGLVKFFSYVALVPVTPMPISQEMPAAPSLPPVAPNQRQTMAIDFGNFLPTGVTLTGTPTLTLSVISGTDASPQSRLVVGPAVGTAAIAQGGSGVTNAAITFTVANCQPGVMYLVTGYCSRTDGDIAEASTRFPCRNPS